METSKARAAVAGVIVLAISTAALGILLGEVNHYRFADQSPNIERNWQEVLGMDSMSNRFFK
jgi:hypothetical protein